MNVRVGPARRGSLVPRMLMVAVFGASLASGAPARGGLVGSNINTSNKEASPRGFEFLANIGDHADPARSPRGSGPLEDRGGVDDATILAHLEPMRSMRPWPNDPAPSAASDLAIHRVIASGGRGATVELRTAP